eukprot:TRINITY_DN12212_c0_g1_i5.p2 TRINITY_DN12212_c0_g1~~TRINITY_DN12212_c0_g1_i5.p2  ORF type:complete len:122 (-),score=9.80 TRINITY_DN12212_c0_g1_i5:411-776(-)
MKEEKTDSTISRTPWRISSSMTAKPVYMPTRALNKMQNVTEFIWSSAKCFLKQVAITKKRRVQKMMICTTQFRVEKEIVNILFVSLNNSAIAIIVTVMFAKMGRQQREKWIILAFGLFNLR